MANNAKTVALLALLGGIFVGAGWFFFGQQGALIALGIAVIFNFAMYWFSDKLAIKAARARPVAEHELPDVYGIVRSLTMRAGMPMPDIYLIHSKQPNAFATGRNPKHAAVAVTTGIVDALNYQELEGVLAHELAHVKNRDILIGSVAATIGVALSFLARMAFWGGMGRRGGGGNNALTAIVGLAAIIIAPIVALIIRMAISRSREFEADRSGSELTGSPLTLASALSKLDEGTAKHPMEVGESASTLFIADPFRSVSEKRRREMRFSSLFSTHPPIAERIDRLTQMASPLS
ncbi:MAG: M48 family metalloprotease [Acidobacteria bacterium]|nr:M48 family metalloprotease [Acidobacteriota bacterium]